MIQLSIAARNAKLNAMDEFMSGGSLLRIMSGVIPINCKEKDTGLMLAELKLYSGFMQKAAEAVKENTNEDELIAIESGYANYFRFVNNQNECNMQGTISIEGGAGDMIVDRTSITKNQKIIVLSISMFEGNP